MKPSLLGLLIAALAFAASTIYLSRQLGDERALADKLVEESRRLNARIAELEKVRAAPTFATAGSFGAGSGARTAGVPAPPAAATWEIVEKGPDSATEVVVNAPRRTGKTFVKMMRLQARAHNRRMYADVGTELGLSKEQAGKLIELLTDQENQRFAMSYDANDPTQGQPPDPRSPSDDKSEIANLIGADKLQALEDYQKTLPARQELEMLSRQLEGLDAPLNDEQRQRMLAVIVEEQKRVAAPAGSADIPPMEMQKKYADWQEDYNERLAAQARGILSTEQSAAFDEYHEWQKEIRSHMATIRPTMVSPGRPATMSFSGGATAVAADTVLLVPEDPADERRRAQ